MCYKELIIVLAHVIIFLDLNIFFPGMLCAMLVLLLLGGILVLVFPGKWTVVAYGSAGALVSPKISLN